jgi:signal transduction histidine kinase
MDRQGLRRQTIWVEDADGRGARFCFTLPVARQPATVA